MKTFQEFHEETEQVDESLAAFLLVAALSLSGMMTDAMTILRQVNPDLADVEIVELQKLPPQVHSNAEAFHISDGGNTIYINTKSEVYQAAHRGDRAAIVKLASIIAHEAWHVQNGSDEKGAYQAQLTVLRQLRAPNNLVDGVRRAMKTVTR